MPIVLAVLLALLPNPPGDEPPRPSLSIRLVRPRAQGERVLGFFQEARSPHPAAALAAYRRARGGESGLSKAAEAAIAAINPRMIAELASLDDASLAFSRAPDGRLCWNALIPRDDGTFAALATALTLTDGGPDAPIDGLAVDRLGPRDAPVATRAPGAFVLASSRDDLRAGIDRARTPVAPCSEPGGALVLGLDPRFLVDKGQTLAVRRVGEALLGLGCTTMEATIAFGDDSVSATITGTYKDRAPCGGVAMSQRWLEGIPVEGTVAAFVFAIDPAPAARDRAFAILDRVEKADPARAAVAPLRVRLDLFARLAGVRPEVDVWPVVKGVSGFVSIDASGRVDGVLLRLHAIDEAAAARLRDAIVPRIVAALRLKSTEANGRLAIEAGGYKVTVDRRRSALVIGLGPTIADRSAAAEAGPFGGVGFRFRGEAQRCMLFWPGRLRWLNLPDAQLVAWVGRSEGNQTIDTVFSNGLKSSVRRIVDRLPFDPPPDPATIPAAVKP
jgi:hypothetical protein